MVTVTPAEITYVIGAMWGYFESRQEIKHDGTLPRDTSQAMRNEFAKLKEIERKLNILLNDFE
jgi:hypothetical protein